MSASTTPSPQSRGPGGPPTTTELRPTAAASSPPPSAIEKLRLIGGLLALSAGLVALIVVVVVALLVKPDNAGVSIATSAIGVIGSIVGAYFGVKIGTDGTQRAVEAQQQEATKAQVFALHTAPGEAPTALANAQELLDAQASARER